MREELLELVCCPACQGDLDATHEARRDGEIWVGTLHCRRCGKTFPVQQGMPRLHLDDAAWAPKAREAKGWVQIHKEMGIYEPDEDPVDLKIPYYPEEPWRQVSRSFDMALDHLDLTGEETVLDLGAGRGWAAKQFALKGCRVVALDVVPDENVGLGRARALMTDAGVYFERIIADGERVPLRPGTFDLVFCAATLHHTSDLPLFVRNIGDVLRRRGRLCAINEPCISILDDEQAVLARDAGQEVDAGINERRPNVHGYVSALRQNGFVVQRAFPAPAYGMDDAELRAWAHDLGAVLGGVTLAEPKRSFWRVYNFHKKRLQALAQGKGDLMQLPAPAGERQQLAYAILTWSSGELFLLAEKS